MRTMSNVSVYLLAISGLLVISAPASGHVSLGTGNASLIGGDLSDPTDTVELSADTGAGLPEEKMIPKNAKWVKIRCAPTSGAYAVPHQRNPYQSWVGAPAAGIFMNKPEQIKWYVAFREGGDGGPLPTDPYYCAIELKDAFVLTHFTLTSGGPDMPDRDPKDWAIQGSNTGTDDDWTDIYVCKAKDRSESPFQGTPFETRLFTSFTSAGLAKAVTPADAKKLKDKLQDKKIEKADFARPAKAFTHYRIAIYSCFNPSAVNWLYRNPNAMHLGQLELFGVPGTKEKIAPKVVKEEPVTPPAVETPFMITYWCGPEKKDTDLAHYKELADCGFNVAFAAIDNLWEKASAEQDEHNTKVLDLCQKVGMKAFIWDGHIGGTARKDAANPNARVPQPGMSLDQRVALLGIGEWDEAPTAETIPQIEKTLDGMIARYSSHPAFLGFILGDEMGAGVHKKLGYVNQYLMKKDPKHPPYYNELPNYASTPKRHERETADFLRIVKPAFYSWDAYWQLHEENELRYYFDNLEVVRRLCLKAKTPYTQIICSIEHMGYRACSEGDLRWQVWTSLAYGTRGITYFTYCHVPGMATGDAPGFVDKQGKPSFNYYNGQKINRRIIKLAPTLVKLTSTGVYHTGALPPSTIPLLPEAPIKKADGGDMVLGCFADAKGVEYIMPVNRSMGSAITAALTLDDKFVSAQEISQETGKPLAAVSVTGKTLDVPLEAGEGKLFLLNKKK
ncbi:MAG: hypothetical protein WCK05_03925 [Planctomycetota bacterium]